MSTGGARSNELAYKGSCRTTLDHVSTSVRETLRIIFCSLCPWCRHCPEAPDPLTSTGGKPDKAGFGRISLTPKMLSVSEGGYAQVVQRGHAPLKVAVATQTSFLDYRKPLQSPTPKLKIELPGRAVSAGGSTASSSQTTTPPALMGQQSLPVSGEGAQTASPSQVGSATAKPVRSPRSLSRERGPRSHEKTSSSKERHSSCATPILKGQEQEVSGASLPGTSTASLAGVFVPGADIAPKLLIPLPRREVSPTKQGGYAQVVQRGHAPLKVAVATQTSFLDYRKPLQSPTPKLKIELPGRAVSAGGSTASSSQTTTPPALMGQQSLPVSGEGAQTASPSQVGSATAKPVRSPRSLSRERGPRSHEKTSSSKERHSSCATPILKGQEQEVSGASLPGTSTASLAGADRILEQLGLALPTTEMDTLKPPEPLRLSGNLEQNWIKFKQRLEWYLKATGFAKKKDK
ncbi:hypothetical protein ISCGN_026629 [Ixodes scapularis]